MDLTGSIKDGVVFPGIDLANMPEPDMKDMAKWEIPAGVGADKRTREHVILLKIPKKSLTEGGLILPDSVDRTSGQEICWVMQTGPSPDIDVRPNDIVLCTRHSFSVLPFLSDNLRKRSPEHVMEFGAAESSPSCILSVQRTNAFTGEHTWESTATPENRILSDLHKIDPAYKQPMIPPVENL